MTGPGRFRAARAGPLAVGLELAAGTVRAVAGRRSEGRLRVSGVASAALGAGAIRTGLVVDRDAAVRGITAALREVEHGDRAARICLALDGDDVRTFHLVTTFERESAGAPITEAEVARAVREARADLGERARRAASEDAALRAIPYVQIREDPGQFALDGRMVASLVGHQGRYVDARSDVTIAPLVVSGAASAALAQAGRAGSLVAGAYALGRLLAAAGADPAVVVRLGSDMTTVAVVRTGAVTHSRAFSIGRHEIAQRASADDAGVWAACVVEALGEGELPSRWLVAGVGDDLASLPSALAEAAHERCGARVEVEPLRTSDVAQVLGDVAVQTEDLVAAGACALAAEAAA